MLRRLNLDRKFTVPLHVTSHRSTISLVSFNNPSGDLRREVSKYDSVSHYRRSTVNKARKKVKRFGWSLMSTSRKIQSCEGLFGSEAMPFRLCSLQPSIGSQPPIGCIAGDAYISIPNKRPKQCPNSECPLFLNTIISAPVCHLQPCSIRPGYALPSFIQI